MLRNLKNFEGLAVTATDGAIGEINHALFDEETSTVRYFVVNTGVWNEKWQVLISPQSIIEVDWEGNQVHVDLTMDQVKHSPKIDAKKPIHRESEREYSDYYGYAYYWTGAPLAGVSSGVAVIVKPVSTSEVRLHSEKDLQNAYVAAIDGDIGHISGLIIDQAGWEIRYLVVNTSNWWVGKKVLVAPQWLSRVDWAQSKVYANLTREAIKESPRYDESALPTRDYETRLYEHYGFPLHWE